MQIPQVPDPSYDADALAIVYAANALAVSHPSLHPAAAMALAALADDHIRAWWGPSASDSEGHLRRMDLPSAPAVLALGGDPPTLAQIRDLLGLRFITRCIVRGLQRTSTEEPSKRSTWTQRLGVGVLGAAGLPFMQAGATPVLTRGDLLYGLAHTPELRFAMREIPRGFYAALDHEDPPIKLVDVDPARTGHVRSAAIVAVDDDVSKTTDVTTFLERAFGFSKEKATLRAYRIETRGAEPLASGPPELALWMLQQARIPRDQIVPSLELRCVVTAEKVAS